MTSPPPASNERRVQPRTGPPVTLAFGRSGPADAQAVVLLHGLGDDRTLWRRVAPVLARDHDVVAIDLPGHGRSGPVPDGASIEWFAAVVGQLVVDLGVADPVIVGLSMGGGVAQYIAIDDVVSLRGLVLVSTSPVLPDATRQRFRDRAELARREGMAAVVDATVSRWFTDAFAREHPEEVATTRATAARTDPASFAFAGLANSVRDCVDRLDQIDCPVLFIGGLDDPADPLRAVEIYERRIPHVRVRLIPDASHLLPVEQPDRVLSEITSFLADISRVTSPAERP